MAASAQTAPPPSKQVESVTVTGQKDLDAVVSQFIGAHSARDKKTGQFLRATDLGICPTTIGLSKGFNDFVTARVLAVAGEVGAPVQPAPCTVNVQIIFSSEAQKLVDRMMTESQGAMLGVHFSHDIAPLSKMTHPVQSWYMTGTRAKQFDSNGIQSTDHDPPFAGGYTLDSAYRRGPERHVLGSHLDMRIQSAIVNVLIVADTDQLQGAEIGPISDYMTLLALTKPQAIDDCSPLPSILDLFSSGCGAREKPKALTDTDMTYLKTLYAADLAARAGPQEHSLTKSMAGALDGSTGGK